MGLPPTHSAPSAMLTKLAVWQGGLQICPGFDGCPISWATQKSDSDGGAASPEGLEG